MDFVSETIDRGTWGIVAEIQGNNCICVTAMGMELTRVALVDVKGQGFTKHIGWMSREARISFLKDVSGIIKPSRMTLLLGPPGCGKTTLLLALARKLSKSLKITGDVSYNGCKLDEFVPHKTSAYISQNDLHISQNNLMSLFLRNT